MKWRSICPNILTPKKFNCFISFGHLFNLYSKSVINIIVLITIKRKDAHRPCCWQPIVLISAHEGLPSNFLPASIPPFVKSLIWHPDHPYLWPSENDYCLLNTGWLLYKALLIHTNLIVLLYFIIQAISNFEQAADYYKGEESNSSANKCLLKVAQYAAQLEQYPKAIEIYEQVRLLYNHNHRTSYFYDKYKFRLLEMFCMQGSLLLW